MRVTITRPTSGYRQGSTVTVSKAKGDALIRLGQAREATPPRKQAPASSQDDPTPDTTATPDATVE